MSEDSKDMKAASKATSGKVTAEKSTKDAHGGGNKYNQMRMGKGFVAIPPIAGHKQKSNVKK